MSLGLKEISREKFIETNLGLVHSCANRFRGKGIEYEELYAAGCVGLVKAYDAFDTDRGVQFSTYAVPVILGEIKKLFRDGGMVKVTRSVKELSLKINYARDILQKRLGHEPTLKDISFELNVPVEDVAQAVYNAFKPQKLNYEMIGMGNGGAHMHWHIFPRNEGDLDGMTGPVWRLDPKDRVSEKYRITDEQLCDIKTKLNKELDLLI